MTDLSAFVQYNKLADMLIAQASKDQIAECARLLVLNLAHYQSKFGDLPLEETLAMIDADVPNVRPSQIARSRHRELGWCVGNSLQWAGRGDALGNKKHRSTGLA